jgi:hypothetical protein
LEFVESGNSPSTPTTAVEKKSVTFGLDHNRVKTFVKNHPLGNFEMPKGQPSKPALKSSPEKSLVVVEKPKGGVWAIKKRK